MDDVVRMLAIAAAGVIVRAMGSAAWQAARSRWTQLLGRGDAAHEAAIGRQLDESAAELNSQQDRGAAERDICAELRGSLRALLRDHPELVDGVRAELENSDTELVTSVPGIQQHARMTGGGVSIQSGRDTTIH